MPDEALSDEIKKKVFAELVTAQDQGLSVKGSRQQVARKFGLTPHEVEVIEREGLANNWPPLD
jgi:hypothetical protein